MAEKRKIVIDSPDQEEEPREEESWWEWFRYKYAKYWYGLLAITVTSFTMLEFLRHDEWEWALGASLASGLGLVLLFSLGYLKLWGKGKDEEDWEE